MWISHRNTQSRVQHDKEEDPRTGPNKDPDEESKKPRTCVGQLDRGELDTKAETKNSFVGSLVLNTTKYGSEDLVAMNTMVTGVSSQ